LGHTGTEEDEDDNPQEQDRLVSTPQREIEISPSSNKITMNHDNISHPNALKGSSTSHNNNFDVESNSHLPSFYSHNHLIDPRDFYSDCVIPAKSRGMTLYQHDNLP